MKQLVKVLGVSVVFSIGFELGTWLWDEVLEDKIEEVKKRLEK